MWEGGTQTRLTEWIDRIGGRQTCWQDSPHMIPGPVHLIVAVTQEVYSRYYHVLVYSGNAACVGRNLA